jgi:mRNA interferase YafQ
VRYKLLRVNNFKRSFKKSKLNDDEELAYVHVVYKLLNNEPLEAKYKDHQLKGNFEGCRECHLKPDLLLVYKIKNEVLELIDIGTHSELF